MSDSLRVYMDMLNCKSDEEVYAKVRQLAGNLTDREQTVLSVILQIHASVENELRQVLQLTLHPHLFLTDDEIENEKTEIRFSIMIDKLGFRDMQRLLEPALTSWPYPELRDISEINTVRNQAAHARDIRRVSYKGRNPFTDPDCLAQMFIDTFAFRSAMRKFVDHAVTRQQTILKRYIEKYGSDLCL
ncbi:MAG: hypothetical protein AO396_07015 [Candidatus Fermentibacter daniensis]|jgi:hypothetical protein|nr:MAG: hypothetical protein AO396_07015 [Candidatus Fermentibacter daniensis]